MPDDLTAPVDEVHRASRDATAVVRSAAASISERIGRWVPRCQNPGSFGVPYGQVEARRDGDDVYLVTVCPLCGLEVRDEVDVAGERTTNNYGAHFAPREETP